MRNVKTSDEVVCGLERKSWKLRAFQCTPHELLIRLSTDCCTSSLDWPTMQSVFCVVLWLTADLGGCRQWHHVQMTCAWWNVGHSRETSTIIFVVGMGRAAKWIDLGLVSDFACRGFSFCRWKMQTCWADCWQYCIIVWTVYNSAYCQNSNHWRLVRSEITYAHSCINRVHCLVLYVCFFGNILLYKAGIQSGLHPVTL